MIPLCMAEHGQPQVIKKVGGSPEVKQHLETLGFTAGGVVELVSALGGNLIADRNGRSFGKDPYI